MQAVVEAAKKAGYQVDFYDWDGSKEWLKTNAPHYQVVLPILHGKGGEDGQIQEILEALNVKYLGSQPEAARVCFDKKQARQLVEKLGFKVPKGAVMGYESYTHSELVNRPHVVKPVMGGSSIHTHIVKDIVHMDVPAIEETFRIYNKLLVEECIIGVEVTAAVLDGVDMPLVEIIPPEGELFDYENKYNGATQELCPPAHVSVDVQALAVTMAKNIHKSLGCRHISRTDFMINEQGDIYFLETNTIPGLTHQSLFPKAAATVGLEFPELVDYFIKLTLKKV